MPTTADQVRPTQDLVIRMPTELHGEIKRRAAHDDLTMSQLVRRAVRHYLAEEGPGDMLR